MRTVLALVVYLLCALPARATTWTWEELYKGGNYIDAGLTLKKKIEAGHKTIANYYYYADCLLRQGKEMDALTYYKIVYKMDPKSQYGKYAFRVLRRYGALPQSRPQAKSPIAATNADTSTSSEHNKSTTTTDTKSAPPAEQTISDAEIKRKLPPITQTPAPSPSLQDISLWSIPNQAGYYSEAAARVDAAQQRLEDAQRLLSQATAATGGLSNPFRQYGESEEQTRTRVEAGKQRAEAFLKPYTDNVAYYSKQLENEQAILRLCLTARNTIYIIPPYGYPVYRPY